MNDSIYARLISYYGSDHIFKLGLNLPQRHIHPWMEKIKIKTQTLELAFGSRRTWIQIQLSNGYNIWTHNRTSRRPKLIQTRTVSSNILQNTTIMHSGIKYYIKYFLYLCTTMKTQAPYTKQEKSPASEFLTR